jgi:hypothetical protein
MNIKHSLGAPSRRSFLADAGMGLTGMVLGHMLARDGRAASPRENQLGPHFTPKAKAVIWIFLCGGVSQMESFDPKPALDKYAGKKIPETPFGDALADAKNPFALKLERGAEKLPLFPLQTGFKPHGQSGTIVSGFFPHIGGCVDDIAVVRSFWTSSVFHSAQLQFHTGRQPREVGLPTIGAWIAYGLGALNQSLPEYVVLGTPTGSCCGGEGGYGAGYLGPAHGGVRVNLGGKTPVAYLTPEDGSVLPEERAGQLQALGKLNRLAGLEYPDDPALQARIQSYELAARMQTSVPETLDLDKESAETRRLYGLDSNDTKTFGTLCLAARRLVERGVRFVQVFHGTGGFGPWDSHDKLKDGHGKAAREVDKPIAGLLRDLKQRGLTDEVVVVCGTEFGRTPTTGGTGREHSPFGFTCWLTGAGIKGGVVHGATDELGYHAVADRHYVTDLHATVMHLLGLDSHKLEIPGRRRLEIDHGTPIKAVLA